MHSCWESLCSAKAIIENPAYAGLTGNPMCLTLLTHVLRKSLKENGLAVKIALDTVSLTRCLCTGAPVIHLS